MANTGQKVVLTLQQVDVDTGIPTGLTKPNVIGDPDYIPPYTDLTDCPIVANLLCPAEIIATGYTDGSAEIEFSLPDNTVVYPDLAKVRIRVMDSVPAEVANIDFVIPHTPPNYFYGTLAAATLTTSTTYTLRIQYYDGSNVLLAGGDCVTTSGTFITNITP